MLELDAAEARTHTDDGGPAGAASAPPERDGLLYEWNATYAERPAVCVHRLFEDQAARTPQAVAVVCGGQSLTYGELDRRANQVAHHLIRRGTGPETLVGVCLERSPEMVVALLGVWKAGAAYVPLDPGYPPERLSFMIEDAGVQVLLTQEKLKALFPGIGGKAIALDTEWPAVAAESAENPAVAVLPSNLAYVMYTSGSTGRPKGAMILHGGLVNYLLWAVEAYRVEPGLSVPVHSSISFDLTVTSLYPALLAGGMVELLPEEAGAQSLVDALRRSGDRALVKITPAHLDVLSHTLSPQEAAGMTRLFVIGGENLRAESLRFWREHAPATRLVNEYGPTETVVGCCVHEVAPGDPRDGSVPIGRPIANTQLYVLGPDLEPVRPGVVGELYIGGAGVARGYLNREDLTRERFLPDPFSGGPGARLYRTGDLARWRPDGILEYLGRVDTQVKLRGHRIELGEIEATLAGHPDVRSCVVVVREGEPGDKELVAYVVAAGREPPAAQVRALRAHLKEHLPEVMVPAHVVLMEALPLTRNGKVDRDALPAPAAEPWDLKDVDAPRTETEKAVAAIWAGLLKRERIGIHEDVFDLGAHSLMAMRALAQVREVFGVNVPTRNLFEHPTVAAFAGVVDRLAFVAGANRAGAAGEREEIEL
ncbi:MAG TPA: amino acid adenylation domain-containing protein [Beijerinckiaceae bacterium]|jgi:amino acid adenylation domain-containing protein